MSDVIAATNHTQRFFCLGTSARRLPGWDEHHGQFPDQVIGLARTISRRAMREHRLAFNDEGRVVELTEGRHQAPPPRTFSLEMAGEKVIVRYTPDYFPDGQDHLYFTSPHEPVQAHCLSSSDYFSLFVRHDAVDACGGAEAFARQFADARVAGQEQDFMQAFEGKRPEVKKWRKAREEKETIAEVQAE